MDTRPTLSQSNANRTFSTERLQLAIYLHASQRLALLGCEVGANHKIRFVFADQDCSGPQAELEFDRGAEVAASGLFASQKYLRRAMSMANNRRPDESDYERKQ
jgi:hypothetical protein